MFKKIVWFMGFFACLFLCVGNSQASANGYSYENGWFDNHPGTFTAPAAIFDNNLNTMAYTPITVTLNQPVDVGVVAFYMSCDPGGFGLIVQFFDSQNKQVHRSNIGGQACNNNYVSLLVEQKVKKIVFTGNSAFTPAPIKEFELFDQSNLEGVTGVRVNSSFNSMDATWELPSKAVGTKIFIDDVFIKTVDKETTNYRFKDLKPNTDYKLSFVATYSENKESLSKNINARTTSVPALTDDFIEVININADNATLKFDYSKLPSVARKVIIYDKNSIKVAEVGNGTNVYKIAGLTEETEYKYFVEVYYTDDIFTNKKSVEFKTNVANREVSNLTASSTAKDVSLKWKMPSYKNLDVARIYRQKDDVNLLTRFFSSASTYEPIFETNGTTFKDLTVKADTEYTYKVTTVDTNDNETDGKTVKIRTKKMSVSGGGTELDENGDYVITWTSPTTGKIKVLVGGEQFAIVQASDQRIVIPRDRMKFDVIGNPDVRLVPIDEDGNEGIPSRPGAGEGTGNGGIGDIVGGGEVAEIINERNLLNVVMALLLLIGGFLLLALAFEVVPKIVKMLRTALLNRKKKDDVYMRRRIEE